MKTYILTAIAALSITAASAVNNPGTNPEKFVRKTSPVYGNFVRMKIGTNTISITCKSSVKLCMVVINRFEDDAASNFNFVSVLKPDGSVYDQFNAGAYRSMSGSGPEETDTIFELP